MLVWEKAPICSILLRALPLQRGSLLKEQYISKPWEQAGDTPLPSFSLGKKNNKLTIRASVVSEVGDITIYGLGLLSRAAVWGDGVAQQ